MLLFYLIQTIIVGLKQILIFGEYLLRIWYSDSKIGTRIVKLVLEYSLLSCDPAHMMYLLSGSNTMKAVEFQWHKFLSGTQWCVCIIEICKILQISINHVVILQVATIFVNTWSLSLESTRILKIHDHFSRTLYIVEVSTCMLYIKLFSIHNYCS